MVTFDNANFPDPPPELVLQRGRSRLTIFYANSLDHPPKPALQKGRSRLTVQIFQILLLGWSCKEESQVHEIRFQMLRITLLSRSCKEDGLSLTILFANAPDPDHPPEAVLQRGRLTIF